MTTDISPGLPARGGVAADARLLTALLATAFVISVIHYTDNAVNIDDYPRFASDGLNPEGWFVGLMWLPFTAAGIAGWRRYRRDGPSAAALLLLALYSGSGLVGTVHYLVPGAFDMPWWRQLHIIVDILCGAAVFAFTLRAALGRGEAR